MRKIASIIVFIVLAPIVLAVVRISPFHFIDDAYITFRYAENLAQGHGLVFNIGERVEGYSSTVHLLLLAALAKVTGWAPTGAMLISILAFVGVLSLFVGFVLRFCDDNFKRPLPVLAFAFLLLHPSNIGYAESGMETSLATLLLLAATWIVAAAAEKERAVVLPAVAGLAAVVAALTRPEMIALAAPYTLWLFASRPGGRWRRAVPFAATVAVGFGAFLLWRHAYFGEWQPNTYYAKTAGAGLSLIPAGLLYLFHFANATIVPYLLAGVVLAVWRLKARPPAWWWGILGVVATHTAAVVYVGGDHFPLGRFLVPVMPLALALLVQGAREVRQAANAANPALAARCLNPAAWVAVVLLLPLTVGLGMFYRNGGVNFIRNGAQAVSWCEIGRAMAENSPPDTTVALIPIGAFGYCSKLPIVDLVGLTDKTIARTPTDLTRSAPGHGRFNSRYVLEQKKPKYVLMQIRRTEVPAPEWAVRRGIVHLAGDDLVRQREFAEDYAFHRMTLLNGFVHYWSRRDFESEQSNSGSYPVAGFTPAYPLQEPPAGIRREQYFEDDEVKPEQFEVPEGWEVW